MSSTEFIDLVNATHCVFIKKKKKPKKCHQAFTAAFHDISDISFIFLPDKEEKSHMKHTAPTDRKKCQSLEHSG